MNSSKSTKPLIPFPLLEQPHPKISLTLYLVHDFQTFKITISSSILLSTLLTSLSKLVIYSYDNILYMLVSLHFRLMITQDSLNTIKATQLKFKLHPTSKSQLPTHDKHTHPIYKFLTSILINFIQIFIIIHLNY